VKVRFVAGDALKDKLKNQYKIVEFISLDDAYRGN